MSCYELMMRVGCCGYWHGLDGTRNDVDFFVVVVEDSGGSVV